MRSPLEILVPDIQGWAIVKYQFSTKDDDAIIYGEHVIGCSFEFDGKVAHWCWEWQDAKLSNEKDKCYECDQPVPEEIVALVAMMNWNKVAR